MNAIVGDNGIITQAQSANVQSGMAALEEYLQGKYVENYEEFSDEENKILLLMNKYSNYFYIPANEGIGSLRYIVDSEGHALYLIKKSGLPDEIKEQLVGGEAGEKTYADYAGLNDVYGVTSNLKVYYCSGEKDSEGNNIILGATNADLDKDNPLREIYQSSSNIGNVLTNLGYDSNGDGIITAQEIKSAKSLTINQDSGISSLKDIYNLTSLEKIVLSNITLENLDGLENCTKINYIYLDNCNIKDYQAIGKLGDKIKYLYLYNINDDELAKLCSKTSGIGNYDLNKLEYFGIMGNDYYVNYPGAIASYDNVSSGKSTNLITSISELSNLSINTKKAIKYLLLNNNNIDDFSGLIDFTNVYLLRGEYNNLKDLNGLQNMSNLTYLFLTSNKLRRK